MIYVVVYYPGIRRIIIPVLDFVALGFVIFQFPAAERARAIPYYHQFAKGFENIGRDGIYMQIIREDLANVRHLGRSDAFDEWEPIDVFGVVFEY